MSSETAPTVTTWADGYGTWHALVPRPKKHEIIALGRAVAAIDLEIMQRLSPSAYMDLELDVERAPEYDTETHIAFKEKEATE